MQFDQIYVHILFFDCHYFATFLSVMVCACLKQNDLNWNMKFDTKTLKHGITWAFWAERLLSLAPVKGNVSF